MQQKLDCSHFMKLHLQIKDILKQFPRSETIMRIARHDIDWSDNGQPVPHPFFWHLQAQSQVRKAAAAERERERLRPYSMACGRKEPGILDQVDYCCTRFIPVAN